MSLLNKFDLKPSEYNVAMGRAFASMITPMDLIQFHQAGGRKLTLDANDLTAIFSRELEYIDKRVIKVEHEPMKGELLVPYESLGGPGVTSQTYRMSTSLGRAGWVGNTPGDLNRVDVTAAEFSRTVHPFGAEYSFTVFELLSIAENPSINLESERKAAAQDAIQRFHDRVALVGDSDKGWYGLVNVTGGVVPLVSPITGVWTGGSVTPAQIVADINKLTWSVVTATKEIFTPDTLLLPISYGELLEKPIFDGTSGGTVYEFIKNKSKHITKIEFCADLDLGDAAGTGPRAMVYKRDPKCVRYGAHAMFHAEAPQRDGLFVKVPCWGKSSGTQFIQPKSAAYMDGI